jgi:hypothetical protein
MKLKSLRLRRERAQRATQGRHRPGRLGRTMTETGDPDAHQPVSLESMRRQVELASSRGLPQDARSRSVMQDRLVNGSAPHQEIAVTLRRGATE